MTHWLKRDPTGGGAFSFQPGAVMTAADRARELARTGSPWALAVHIAAREYGCSGRDVTARLGQRRASGRVVRVRTITRRWWED